MASPMQINTEVLTDRLSVRFGPVRDFQVFDEDNCDTVVVIFEDERRALVRFRTHEAGVTPGGQTSMASEEATMGYLRRFTNVPVLDVLWYDNDADRGVGGEWMVLEHLGVSLQDKWVDMSIEQRRKLASGIAEIWSELVQPEFDGIGSLWRTQDTFRVGPVAPTSSADALNAQDVNRGPFYHPEDWLVALASGQLGSRSSVPPTPVEDDCMAQVADSLRDSPSLGNADKHLPIGLQHANLHVGNILVDPEDPSVIVAVTNWEGARTAPLWAIQPRFLVPPQATREEILDWQKLIREAVGSLAPDWLQCTGQEEPWRLYRKLHKMAQDSRIFINLSPVRRAFEESLGRDVASVAIT
ncbi:hypothetical protein OE88DRAFT_1646733 [Heliocybe sulcata]|uniref:Aminoglycoside phosphotransferase domain-containing protein n=1 Tax=Heliocybe sulcata TaxID=5364 RepID=A0A5C3MWD0_9AGAM|nr:hypothetical protein OE88DRAFT_1646733 [Heliocybe sulcata]